MKRHQFVILLGCLVAAGMCLYPPMIGVQLREGDNLERFIGYYRLDKEPEYHAIRVAMFNTPHIQDRGLLSARLDTQRLAVQIVGVLIVTFGLGFALRRNIS